MQTKQYSIHFMPKNLLTLLFSILWIGLTDFEQTSSTAVETQSTTAFQHSDTLDKITYYNTHQTTPDQSQIWEIYAHSKDGTELRIPTTNSPSGRNFPAISHLIFSTEVKITENIHTNINSKVTLICGSDQGKHNKVIFLSDTLPIGSIDFREESVKFTKKENGGYYAEIYQYRFDIELDIANGPMLLIRKTPNTPSELHQ
ncbi:hypothetical protein [Suttonella ornithocola]|uniref:Uncharacterized protein n=1 Tax=Suttonella ornithocola TaxID=279832 RepID=A0A380MPG0_9GAMM|nr:hypothetical protein [Suttonella ornithocola]SUO93926.1 Uncharacterised protein [Suttonella ornithocola]